MTDWDPTFGVLSAPYSKQAAPPTKQQLRLCVEKIEMAFRATVSTFADVGELMVAR